MAGVHVKDTVRIGLCSELGSEPFAHATIPASVLLSGENQMLTRRHGNVSETRRVASVVSVPMAGGASALTIHLSGWAATSAVHTRASSTDVNLVRRRSKYLDQHQTTKTETRSCQDTKKNCRGCFFNFPFLPSFLSSFFTGCSVLCSSTRRPG